MTIYVAFYKGRKSGRSPKALAARAADWLIRKASRGIYSHCEIAVEMQSGRYRCYSASARDGGVRVKTMFLPSEKWDLIKVADDVGQTAMSLYSQTQRCRYDWRGVADVLLATAKLQQGSKWFCSEWCAQALGFSEPWRYSPSSLADAVKSRRPFK